MDHLVSCCERKFYVSESFLRQCCQEVAVLQLLSSYALACGALVMRVSCPAALVYAVLLPRHPASDLIAISVDESALKKNTYKYKRRSVI